MADTDTDTGMDMDTGMYQRERDIIGGVTLRGRGRGESRVRVCGRFWRSERWLDGISFGFGFMFPSPLGFLHCRINELHLMAFNFQRAVL